MGRQHILFQFYVEIASLHCTLNMSSRAGTGEAWAKLFSAPAAGGGAGSESWAQQGLGQILVLGRLETTFLDSSWSHRQGTTMHPPTPVKCLLQQRGSMLTDRRSRRHHPGRQLHLVVVAGYAVHAHAC